MLIVSPTMQISMAMKWIYTSYRAMWLGLKHTFWPLTIINTYHPRTANQ